MNADCRGCDCKINLDGMRHAYTLLLALATKGYTQGDVHGICMGNSSNIRSHLEMNRT